MPAFPVDPTPDTTDVATNLAPAPAIATADELKARLNLKRAVSADEDAFLAGLLAGASTFVSRYAGREFVPDPASDGDPETTRLVTAFGDRLVRIPDTRSLSAVIADGVVVDPADYRLRRRGDEPAHAIRFLFRACYEVELTGRFGYAAPPDDVRQAVLALAARQYHERNARGADVWETPENGALSYFRQMPPAVAAVLDRYRIPGL